MHDMSDISRRYSLFIEWRVDDNSSHTTEARKEELKLSQDSSTLSPVSVNVQLSITEKQLIQKFEIFSGECNKHIIQIQNVSNSPTVERHLPTINPTGSNRIKSTQGHAIHSNSHHSPALSSSDYPAPKPMR